MEIQLLNFIRQRTTAVYEFIPIYLCTRHFARSILSAIAREFWTDHSPKRVVDSRKFNHLLQGMRVLDPTRVLADLFVGELQKVCHRIHSYFLLLLRTECSPVHGADVLFDVHNLAKFTKSSLGCGYIPEKTPCTTWPQPSRYCVCAAVCVRLRRTLEGSSQGKAWYSTV